MLTDQELLVMAYQAATKSPDPSTQNGAVIPHKSDFGGWDYVTACNTFPEGVEETPERLVRPLKYNFIEHAERNAIFEGAKAGIFNWANHSPVMYVPWFACADCARAIICSGIRKVVGHKRMMDATPDHWKESIQHAFVMFKEAGVETVLIPDELRTAPTIRFNGELWQP
jgi:dCMP deaminase